MNYCYGKGASLLGGCPYLGGSFIGGSTVYSHAVQIFIPAHYFNNANAKPIHYTVGEIMPVYVQWNLQIKDTLGPALVLC